MAAAEGSTPQPEIIKKSVADRMVELSQTIDEMSADNLMVSVLNALANAIADERAGTENKIDTAPLVSSADKPALLQRASRGVLRAIIGAKHVVAQELPREEEREVAEWLPWEERMDRLPEFAKGGLPSRFSRALHFFTDVPEGKKRKVMSLGTDAGRVADHLTDINKERIRLNKEEPPAIESTEVLEAAAIISEVQEIEKARQKIISLLAEILRQDNPVIDSEAAAVAAAQAYLKERKYIINPHDIKDDTHVQARLLNRIYKKNIQAMAALQNTGEKTFYMINPIMPEIAEIDVEDNQIREPCYRVLYYADGNPREILIRTAVAEDDFPELVNLLQREQQKAYEVGPHGKGWRKGPFTEKEKWDWAKKYYEAKWRGDLRFTKRIAFTIGHTKNEARTWVGPESGNGKMTCYSFNLLPDENGKLTPEKCTAFGAHYIVDDANLEFRVANLAQDMRRIIGSYCEVNGLRLSRPGYEGKTLAARKKERFRHLPEGFESKDLLWGPTQISAGATKALEVALEPYGLNARAAFEAAMLLTLFRDKMMPFARNCVERPDGGRLSIIGVYLQQAEQLNNIYDKLLVGQPINNQEKAVFAKCLSDFYKLRKQEIVPIKTVNEHTGLAGLSMYDEAVGEFGKVRELLNQKLIKGLPDRWMRALKSVTSTHDLISHGYSERLVNKGEEFAWIDGATPAMTVDCMVSPFTTKLANGEMVIYFKGVRDRIADWVGKTDLREQEQYFAGLCQWTMRAMKEFALQAVVQNQPSEVGDINPLVNVKDGTACYLECQELLAAKKPGVTTSRLHDRYDWLRLEKWGTKASLVTTGVPHETLVKFQELEHALDKNELKKLLPLVRDKRIAEVTDTLQFIDTAVNKFVESIHQGKQVNNFLKELYTYLVSRVGEYWHDQLFQRNEKLGEAQANVFAELLTHFGATALRRYIPGQVGGGAGDYLTDIKDYANAFRAVMETVR